MRLEPARAILQTVSAAKDDSYYIRHYNMNLYRGCSHGCTYCDARSACYHLENPGEVRAKANALTILEDELRRRRKPGIVGLGGMSDGYNPEEKTALLTRGALTLLARYGYGIGITTKSPLVARDIDLLKTLQQHAPVHVTFSITTADDAMSLLLEPNVAPSGERFSALHMLTEAGIPAGVWINPVLPYLTDSPDNITALLRMAKAHGASYVHSYFGMTLREGNREYFYAALDRYFPGIKQQYVRDFGNAYELPACNAEALYRLYTDECRRLKLPNTFQDINALILRSGGFRQESLF